MHNMYIKKGIHLMATRKPKTSQATREAVQKYQSKFDEIKVRVPKGGREKVLNYAITYGWESLPQFVISAMDFVMARKMNVATLEYDLARRGYKNRLK